MDDLFFDPALQADTIRRESATDARARKLAAISDDLDKKFELWSVDNRENARRLTKADIREMTGLTEAELDAIQKRQRMQKRFAECLPLGERNSLRKSAYREAYETTERAFDRAGGNVTAAMHETLRLFAEFFSADEQEKIRKSIAALDLGIFLKIIAMGMKRSVARVAA